MLIVLYFFWRVCLLRHDPEIVPKHPYFLFLVLVANLVCSITLSTIISGEPALRIATGVLVSVATLASLVYLICSLRGAGDRFVWTLSVLLGCDMVLTAIFAVIVPLAQMLNEVAVLAAYATFMVWSVTVFGFILSRSLKSHMAIGVGLAFSMMLISTGLASLASAG